MREHACVGGIPSNEPSWWARDAQGIELCRVCDDCKAQKLSRLRMDITIRHVHDKAVAAWATSKSGHLIIASVAGLTVDLQGDVDTMCDIDEDEINDVCAAVGLVCTWDTTSDTSYRCIRLTLT